LRNASLQSGQNTSGALVHRKAFDYCDKLPVPEKRLLALIEAARGREMRQLENKEQILSFVLV
jgi:hypothetical protein